MHAKHDADVMPISHTQYTSPLLGEPLNIIISGLSDPFVLTEKGFREYTK